MKQDISMLMDAELDEQDAGRVIARLKDDEGGDWLLYHMIGDAIRDPEGFRADLHLDFSSALAEEPTVLSPPRKSGMQRAGFYALSAAASFAAVSLVGWVALQSPSTSPVPKQVAQAVHLNVMKSGLNDYLLAHQEFSPRSDMLTSNIRTVSDTYQDSSR